MRWHHYRRDPCFGCKLPIVVLHGSRRPQSYAKDGDGNIWHPNCWQQHSNAQPRIGGPAAQISDLYAD